MKKNQLFSFLPESNNTKPFFMNRSKHNQLQLAISPDSPNYFKYANTKLHPVLRETIFKENQKKSGKNKQQLDMLAVRQLGKSVNIEEINKMMNKRQYNLNMIEEKKVNETEMQGEERVVRNKTYIREDYDHVHHLERHNQLGGEITNQKSNYQENYYSYYTKDSNAFKWKSGEFEHLANFMSGAKFLLKDCKKEQQHSKPQNTRKSNFIAQNDSSGTLAEKRLRTLSTPNQRGQPQITFGNNQDPNFYLPSIQKSPQNQILSPRTQRDQEDPKVQQYLKEHVIFENNISKQISQEYIKQILKQPEIPLKLKDQLKARRIKQKKKDQEQKVSNEQEQSKLRMEIDTFGNQHSKKHKQESNHKHLLNKQ